MTVLWNADLDDKYCS